MGTIVLHSGGLDSLVPLYLLLTETTEPVMALHVHRRGMPHDRGDVEHHWTLQQWQWLLANTRPFTTRIARLDREVYQDRIYFEVMLEQAGLNVDRIFKRVMSGRCQEDDGMPTADWSGESFTAACGIPYSEARHLSPVRHLPKAELAALIPPELLALVWGCDVPIHDTRDPGHAGAIQCGLCVTCQQYRAAGIFEAVYQITPP